MLSKHVQNMLFLTVEAWVDIDIQRRITPVQGGLQMSVDLFIRNEDKLKSTCTYFFPKTSRRLKRSTNGSKDVFVRNEDKLKFTRREFCPKMSKYF